MNFSEENNSIFDSPDINENSALIPIIKNLPEVTNQSNTLDSFINKIKSKINETKKTIEDEKLAKSLEKMTEDNSEILLILKSFGCTMTLVKQDKVLFKSDELNLSGYATIKDGVAEMDEDCKQLFEVISQIITGGYRIDEVLAKYEEQEFYPIGEIQPVEINYKGTKITASQGTLANPQGEFKTILFYKGYEILSDEQLAEREKNNNSLN
ncbi:hypothetical protein IKJ53_07330 [bacterium]|nr:hypothetical protein [bacterium]